MRDFGWVQCNEDNENSEKTNMWKCLCRGCLVLSNSGYCQKVWQCTKSFVVRQEAVS